MSPTPPDRPDDFRRFADALAGQYEILREIGRGGMGIVYAARDVNLDRPVAIKTLPSHLASDPTIRERFLREARTAGALSHPGIVPVHRADELGGHVFFVMALIEGQSLAQRVRDGRITMPDAVRVLRDVAASLGYAHRRGIVHRDVKAENIIIDDTTGRALVTDFGIARLAESAPLTATGQMLGTVYYLSPEQINGDAVDGRSDLYSLGVVGYYALAGRFPYDAPLASAVIVAHVTKPLYPLHDAAPHLPVALAAIIDRCLSKNPHDRFQSGEELSTAFTAVLDQIDEASMSIAAASSPVSLISDTEAQAIWERAATLQGDTGIVPRPAPVALARDDTRDLARTSGYDIGNVRAAALAAGIASPYVEHALVEHGLVPSVPARLPLEIEDRSTGGKWIGAPTVIAYEVVLNSEVPTQDFDLLGETIQRTVGENGTLSSVGRSLTWHNADRQRMQITVFARGGKTTIRATEDVRHVVGGITFAGTMIGTVLVGGTLFGRLMATGASVWPALGVWAVVGGLSFLTAASIVGTLAERGRHRLRGMVERLADEVHRSIDADTPPRREP